MSRLRLVTYVSLLTCMAWNCKGDTICSAVNECANTILNDADVECKALLSCFNSTSNIARSKGISCEGELACAGSTITVEGIALANGVRSLAYASVISGYIGLYAALSAQDSYFQDIKFLDFYAHDSGYNALVECPGIDSCSVSCYSSGCNNIIVPDDESLKPTYVCIDALQSEVCPDGYELPFGYEMESIVNEFDFSTIENSLNACENSELNGNGINCDEDQDSQCYEQDVESIGNNSIICCSGEESCAGSGTTITASGSINNIGLRADGSDSLLITNGFVDATDPNAGDVYLTGAAAIAKALFSINGISLTGNGENNLIISGEGFVFSVAQTMYQNYASNFANVYCLAWHSCQGLIIDDIPNNVYAYGTDSLLDSEISNVGGSVYVDHYNSGTWNGVGFDDTKISNVQNNIIAVGELILTDSTITNIGNTIIGYGRRALAGTTIVGVKNIYVDGQSSLAGASITSNNPDTNIFQAYIYTPNANTATICCSEGDLCIIYCESDVGCTNLILTCNGTFLVYCDDASGIACPAGDFLTVSKSEICPTPSPTLSPTFVPTDGPIDFVTQSPSQLPSQSPIQHPSTEPTASPTEFVSQSPSQLPSKQPIPNPTLEPTGSPTNRPSDGPTGDPTQGPSLRPSARPSATPSMMPSDLSDAPSFSPTNDACDGCDCTPTPTLEDDEDDFCPGERIDKMLCADDPNCVNCKSWGCRECRDGYYRPKGRYAACKKCDEEYPGCAECKNSQGCKLCKNDYEFYWDLPCGQKLCRLK